MFLGLWNLKSPHEETVSPLVVGGVRQFQDTWFHAWVYVLVGYSLATSL